MGRKKNRRSGRDRNTSAKPTATVAPQVALQPTPPPQPQGFWKQINFTHFIALFLIPLSFTIILVIPILYNFHLVRPVLESIAAPFIPATGIIVGALALGLFKFSPLKFEKSKQLFFALASGGLLSIVLIAVALPIPLAQSSSYQDPPLTAIPYAPYKGVLVLNGMPTTPSKGYYWEQKANSYGSCKSVDGAYQVSTNNREDLEICSAINTDFKNFAFEVDMTFQHLGDASIFFEANSQAAYDLTISSLGNYAQFSLLVITGWGTQHLSSRSLVDLTPIILKNQGPVIFTPGVTNRIGIVVKNQTIVPYINGSYAPDWIKTDDTSTQGGIALGAFTPSDQTDTRTVVTFSDARLWTL